MSASQLRALLHLAAFELPARRPDLDFDDVHRILLALLARLVVRQFVRQVLLTKIAELVPGVAT